MIKQQKRKTYEEMYGKEKANQIKLKISKKSKGKISEKKNKSYEEMYGEEKTEEIKLKQSIKLKGKTLIERFGKEKANQIKLKKSIVLKGRNKGKKIGSLEERFGKEKANQIKLKMSKKGKIWTKNKIINNLTKIIKKIGPITRSNIQHLYHYYNICSEHVIRDRFGSLDNLAVEANIEFISIKGRVGQTEKQILDTIEKEKNITLLRQFSIAGKYIDGYDRKNNIAYEVDEAHHKYKRIEDTIRENQIKEVLGCEFVRVSG